MKKIVCPCILWASFLLPFSLVQAQTSNIPQVVDGGPWQTTVVITNTSATQTVVSLSFFQNASAGATSTWNLAFKESVQLSALVVPGGSTLFLHTPDTAAATTVGWGQVSEIDGAGSVVAYAIFTQLAAGTLGVGTAPASAGASRILVPFDNTNGAATSMAVINPGSSSETINVGLRIGSATSQPTGITLPSNGHVSFDFPTQFSTTANQSGLAEFYSPSGNFAILALRFQSGALTTAPVYAESGPPIIASSSSGGGGVQGFNGNYTGNYTGTLGSGPVAASISGGTVTVTVPGSGNGTITAGGQITFGVVTGGGQSCNFSGNLNLSSMPISGSGTFSCTSPSGSGTWTATHQ
jgi:hypothetical protein